MQAPLKLGDLSTKGDYELAALLRGEAQCREESSRMKIAVLGASAIGCYQERQEG